MWASWRGILREDHLAILLVLNNDQRRGWHVVTSWDPVGAENTFAWKLASEDDRPHTHVPAQLGKRPIAYERSERPLIDLGHLRLVVPFERQTNGFIARKPERVATDEQRHSHEDETRRS